MSRMVFCRKYQQDLEGLDTPPYPGAKGIDLYNNISKKAWQEWMAHQTLLINEKRLNVMDMGTKVYLTERMNLHDVQAPVRKEVAGLSDATPPDLTSTPQEGRTEPMRETFAR
jgi:Fe-S cluster biosynthesis and repair protein YggX